MDSEHIKRVIKLLPGFYTIDKWRRRCYESSPFDFWVRPLAIRLEQWPAKLVIDTTNRCNARCVWCLNPRSTMKRGTMSLELFKKIIDDYARRGGKVWLSTFGEPLLDNTIIDKMHYLGKLPSIIDNTLLTNALLLESALGEVLLEEKINLDISLDELEQEKFEHVKGISFDKVMSNTLSILRRNREEGNRIRIIIRIKTTDSLENLTSSPYYAQLKEMATFLEVTPIRDTGSIANWGGCFDKENYFTSYFPTTKIYDYHKKYNMMNNAPCSQLWASMTVNWEGKVVLCCVDMESKVILGDLTKETISEVWQGTALRGLRDIAMQRRKREMVLCRECDLHQGWQYLRKYYKNRSELYRDEFVR